MIGKARIATIVVLALLVGGAAVAAAQDEGKEKKKMSKAEIEKALDDRKVTLNFMETPLTDAILFLADISGLIIDIHPAAQDACDGSLVTLKEKDLTLRQALGKVLDASGELRHEVQEGRIVIKLKKKE